MSSCRCWYTFIYFGHDPALISVLDGGLKKWKQEGKLTVNSDTILIKSNYKASENKEMVKSKSEVVKNIALKNFKVVDARSLKRFKGEVPEPRSNVRSGSIPNSICLPFKTLINDDFTFKSKSEISSYFNDLSLNDPVNVVFSCGSGITACVLALAYSQVNNKYLPVIYDGSWAEYGKI